VLTVHRVGVVWGAAAGVGAPDASQRLSGVTGGAWAGRCATCLAWRGFGGPG
jgi:hypothetical protein